MGYPGTRMIIKDFAVMYGTEASVRIFFAEYGGVVFPIGYSFMAHNIILVCQGPPDIAISRKPRNAVIPVKIITVLRHHAETPPIIRMHDDNIRLNSTITKEAYAFFNMPEMFGVKTP
jgi:hypothetical protein